MHRISIILLVILLTACNTPSPAAPAPTQSPAPAIASTGTNIPAPSATLPPAVTATSTQTPAPQVTRWFWAVGEDKVLAFNTEGQVNTVLDIGDIQGTLNDNPPIRVSDDRAVVFFANNDNPRAYILTSDSAIPIDLPEAHATYPQNGWSLQAHNPYFVFTPTGTVTTPAILIDGERGEASLLAANVYGRSDYLIRFSDDGRYLRFATGEDPVKVHNRDLQSGEETVIFQSGMNLDTDPSGELWYDQSKGAGTKADGTPFTLTVENMRYILMNNGWVLAIPRDCDSVCPLQAHPAAGDDAPLNYVLPVELASGIVYVSFAQRLPQDRLLVGVTDAGSGDPYPGLWLLSPDGESKSLGRGIDLRKLPGLSADGRHLLAYSDDGFAYTLYDLADDRVLFSQKTDSPDLFLDVTYSDEAAVILEQDEPYHRWVYNFGTESAHEINIPDDFVYCPTLTPHGDPVCITTDGVSLYDPISGTPTPLIQEPIINLSN